MGTYLVESAKYALGLPRFSINFQCGTNEDFRLGYPLGNIAGLGFGAKSLADGLTILTTPKGVALVTSTGEIVGIVSGTVEGIIQSAKGIGISLMAGNDIKNTYKSIEDAPQYPDGFKAVQNGTKKSKC